MRTTRLLAATTATATGIGRLRVGQTQDYDGTSRQAEAPPIRSTHATPPRGSACRTRGERCVNALERTTPLGRKHSHTTGTWRPCDFDRCIRGTCTQMATSRSLMAILRGRGPKVICRFPCGRLQQRDRSTRQWSQIDRLSVWRRVPRRRASVAFARGSDKSSQRIAIHLIPLLIQELRTERRDTPCVRHGVARGMQWSQTAGQCSEPALAPNFAAAMHGPCYQQAQLPAARPPRG